MSTKQGRCAMAVAAHPDDIEFLMAGTMLLLGQAGFSLHYLNIANGSCGSVRHDAETVTRIRRDEARRAANLLGATFHESLTNDLEIFYDRPTLAQVASVIRAVGPNILLVHSPQDYMEDHMNACRLAVTAAFARGIPNFPVDPPREPIAGDMTIYHAQPHGNCDSLRQPVTPDLFVDVTSVIDRTISASASRTVSAEINRPERVVTSPNGDSASATNGISSSAMILMNSCPTREMPLRYRALENPATSATIDHSDHIVL